MDIKELKSLIESKQLTNIGFIIFKYEDIDFLPNQYLLEICKILNLNTNYIEDISNYIITQNDIFGLSNIDTLLNIFKIKSFNINNKMLLEAKNLIVICNDISDECKDIFSNNIVYFPKLEKWQIKDYVYSVAEGIDCKKLDNLIGIYNYDIYRLDKELDKIRLFQPNERKYIYDDFEYEGLFNDSSIHNIFDFSNALLKKDITSLTSLYKEIEKIDCEPLGLVTTLYQSIRNIILIQLDPNATPEATGLPSNRFWAIKKNACGFYNRDQLLNIFELITSIDKKLKTGEISVNIIIDYIVCHMLSY